MDIVPYQSCSDLAPAIGTILEANRHPSCDQAMMPIIVAGSGAGKTYTVNAIARALDPKIEGGFQATTENYSTKDPVDLVGIPSAGEDGFVKWLTPPMPFEDYAGKKGSRYKKNGFWLADEIDRASTETRNALIPLISSRELAGRKIASGWFFIACMNGETDSVGTEELQHAMKTRGVILYVDNPRIERTVEFGKAHGWHSDYMKFAMSVCGYEPMKFTDLQATRTDSQGKFLGVCNRAHMFASALTYACEITGQDDNQLLKLVQGVAGADFAHAYIQWRNGGAKVSYNDIVRDQLGCSLMGMPTVDIVRIAREIAGRDDVNSCLGVLANYIKRHRREMQKPTVMALQNEVPQAVSHTALNDILNN